MRKTIFMALALVSANAASEWIYAISSGSGSYYVDATTIRRDGAKVKMWILGDLKAGKETPRNKYLSHKSHLEFDCKEEQFHILAGFSYTENMGSGEVDFQNDHKTTKWYSFPPGAAVETLSHVACRSTAEWVYISSVGATNYYTEAGSIHKDGDKVEAWLLSDHPAQERYPSSKSKYEFDCKERQVRGFETILYDQHMGNGKATSQKGFLTGEWGPLLFPNSPIYVLSLAVCQ